jgi:signal transduction histidine kinase/DNA-binding response OmpR family regulator
MREPTILAVDDSPSNLKALQAVLQPLGLRVETAGAAEEALRKLLQQEFALVLLDVHLPGMSGFEIARLLKKHPRLSDVPIIFITGVSRDASHVFEGYAQGAVDYLTKPFEPDLLRAKVCVFVELYRRQQKIRDQEVIIYQHELRELERRNAERVRHLVESTPIPLIGLHADGKEYVRNRAWTELFGPPTPIDGLLAERVVHPDDRAAIDAAWRRAMQSHESFHLECRLLRDGDTTFRWHLLKGVPQATGEAAGAPCIVTAIDIHAEKRADEERERLLERELRAREDAEESNRMKDQFLATVSHELRTPLTAIVGWCSMLNTGILDAEKTAHALQTITRCAQTQARLVNDLLDVSRIATGKLDLNVTRVDLRQVIADSIETVRPTAEATAIAIFWDLPAGDEELPVTGDAPRLQQIVVNLLGNAVKFSPKGGRVRVSTALGEGCVRLSVEDDGIGISSDFLPHIFERFRQADGTATRKHEGLGLGLSIVKHLVESHGGTVVAQSAGIGQGSRFTVTLPLAMAQLPLAEPAARPEAVSAVRAVGEVGLPLGWERRLEGISVLLVDDLEETREVVASILAGCGATVRAVPNGADALSALRAGPADVLVSDIGMPGQDGYELIREVRSLPPSQGGNTPAIALTAYARPEDRRRARDEGYQVHLAKPVEPREFVFLVGSLARARSERRTVGANERTTATMLPAYAAARSA